jgi:hypothetical protein
MLQVVNDAVSRIFDYEDGGSMFIRNVSEILPEYTLSHLSHRHDILVPSLPKSHSEIRS